jgi:hypothetical protein
MRDFASYCFIYLQTKQAAAGWLLAFHPKSKP